MYPTTAQYKATLARSHTVAIRIEIWNGNKFLGTMPCDDGSVSCDNKRTVRRDAWVSLGDPALVPERYTDKLTPFTNELRIFRGHYIPGVTTPEYVPLGRFTITDTEIYDSYQDVSIRVTTQDYASRVADQVLHDEYTIASGQNFPLAIKLLIQKQSPWVVFSGSFLSASTVITPSILLYAGSNIWDAAYSMAEMIGCELFFDVLGVCQLQPVPNPNFTAVSWTFSEGDTNLLMYLNKHLNAKTETFNHIIVIGSHPESDTIIRAEAIDNNPSSPTWIGGPIGDKAKVIQDSSIKDQTQAQLVANSKLQKMIGIAEKLELTNIVNPAHDVNDVVAVVRGRSKVNDRYVLDGLSVPLTHNRAMTLSTRKRQFIS